MFFFSLSIISRCDKGEWILLASGIIDFELLQIRNMDRLEQVQSLYSVADERVKLTIQAEKRAAFFQNNGLKPFDSLHLALAETTGANVFLTTDDRLLRAVKQMDNGGD